METIRATEARAGFAALLRRVSEGGEHFVIERRGKPRAMLVPIGHDQADLPADLAAGRESEALLSQAAQMANLGHWVWDEVQDRCVYCSETLARMNAVTVEAYLARYATLEGLLEEVHPEDRARYEQTIAEAKRARRAYDIEFRDVWPDGGIRYLRECGEPLFDAAGRHIRTIGTLQDITEQRLAELALREGEQRFKDFADATSDWFWEMDESCRFSYFSDRFTEITGLPQEALLGRSREETGIPDLDPVAWQDHLSDIAQHRSFRDFRHRRTHPGGREVMLSVNGKAIFDATGTFKGYRGTGSDITERMRAENALRKTHALFQETERLAKLGHWEWDEIQDKATYCSDELARLHGVTVDEYLEHASSLDADLEWVHPEDRDLYRRTMGELRLRREVAEIEYRLLQADGDILDVLEVVEPVLDARGSLIRSIGIVQDVGDRKRADKALRASESDLAMAQHLAKIGNWRWSVERNELISGSEEYARIHGVEPEQVADLMAHQMDRSVHPEDRERVAEAFRRFDEEGTDYEIEYRIVRPDGTVRHVNEIGEAVLDPSGRAVEQIGTVQDVTEFKRIEAALRQARDELEQRVAERTAELHKANDALTHEIAERKLAEEEAERGRELLASAVEALDEGFVIFDDDDRMVLCNSKYREIYGPIADKLAPGIALEEVARHTARDCAGLEAEDEIEAWVRRRMDRHKHHVVPFEQTLKDGRWIRVSDSRLPNRWTAGTRSDITEQKQVEAALRESEERYRELFEESPVAIWEEDWSPIRQMLDDLARNGVKDWRSYFGSHKDQLKTAYNLARITEISRAAIDLYREESKEEIIRRSTSAVVIDEELDAFREIVLAFLAGQMTFEIEAKDSTGDGSEIVVRRRVVMPPKYREDWSRVIYAIEDVTERARIEEQLRQAQKLEAVGQLTGGVAHDFNNLLAVIMGNAELLAARLGDDDRQAQAVIRAASRGAGLIERLLAFSRQQPLHPQAFDLDAAIAGIADMLRRTLGETIEVKISPTSALWTAVADPGQLENALLNLTINARDAMPGGGRLVIETANVQLDDHYVETHPEAAAGDYVMLAVTDSGTGMTPDVLEHAFEPFFTTKEVGEGSGLGLSMVYGFIKQSEGQLAIYSEPGHGTTVKLYLPRSGAAIERTGPETTAAVPRGQGETVLVVEDDPDVRQLAVTLLVDLGYKVLEAPDGTAALAVLDGSPQPDLLLSDVVLPGAFSGPELVHDAKQLFPDLKVLFMSGYAQSAARHNGLTGGRSELLNKPFHRQDLARKVRAVLDG